MPRWVTHTAKAQVAVAVSQAKQHIKGILSLADQQAYIIQVPDISYKDAQVVSLNSQKIMSHVKWTRWEANP